MIILVMIQLFLPLLSCFGGINDVKCFYLVIIIPGENMTNTDLRNAFLANYLKIQTSETLSKTHAFF